MNKRVTSSVHCLLALGKFRHNFARKAEDSDRNTCKDCGRASADERGEKQVKNSSSTNFW